jgi:hypothetical protein
VFAAKTGGRQLWRRGSVLRSGRLTYRDWDIVPLPLLNNLQFVTFCVRIGYRLACHSSLLLRWRASRGVESGLQYRDGAASWRVAQDHSGALALLNERPLAKDHETIGRQFLHFETA